MRPSLAPIALALLLTPLAACGSDDADTSAEAPSSTEAATTAGDSDSMSLQDLAEALDEMTPDETATITIDDVAIEMRPCFAADELQMYIYGMPSEFSDDPEANMLAYAAELPEEMADDLALIAAEVAKTYDVDSQHFSANALAELREDPEFAAAQTKLGDFFTERCSA